ncbi:hypothetical protein [Tabrizicola sp.]|uniref:hypothetical protein n=1 Tax=Tabrizicola sp. TaxID=2005166 RepID=UPI003D26F6C2
MAIRLLSKKFVRKPWSDLVEFMPNMGKPKAKGLALFPTLNQNAHLYRLDLACPDRLGGKLRRTGGKRLRRMTKKGALSGPFFRMAQT